MDYEKNQYRIWDRNTPDDGDLFNEEFKRIYLNTNFLKGTMDKITGALSVSDNKNVGIGTNDPRTKLEINGSIRGNQEGALRIETPAGYVDVGPKTADFCHFITDRERFHFNKELTVASGRIGSSDESLQLCTSGTPRITVDKETGNVGIGTGNPEAILHVVGNLLGAVKDTEGNPLRVVVGRTIPGATNWNQYGENGVYVWIDISNAGFYNSPYIFTSIGGESHWMTEGCTSIYNLSKSQFQIYIFFEGITLAKANEWKWHINWLAIGK